MGGAVVHFEIMGKDLKTLSAFYSAMFAWEIDSDNEMNYGVIDRATNSNADGIGIGGGIGQLPEGMPAHVTFYVEVPDVEASLVQAVSLGGTRLMGPEKVMEGVEIGMFSDPEGQKIGVIKAVS